MLPYSGFDEGAAGRIVSFTATHVGVCFVATMEDVRLIGPTRAVCDALNGPARRRTLVPPFHSGKKNMYTIIDVWHLYIDE